MPRARKRPSRPKSGQPASAGNSATSSPSLLPPTRVLNAPVFSQPQPTADPAVFKIHHPLDTPAYNVIDQLNKQGKIQPLPFALPRGTPEPQLTLAEVFGSNTSAIDTITRTNKQIVF